MKLTKRGFLQLSGASLGTLAVASGAQGYLFADETYYLPETFYIPSLIGILITAGVLSAGIKSHYGYSYICKIKKFL